MSEKSTAALLYELYGVVTREPPNAKSCPPGPETIHFSPLLPADVGCAWIKIFRKAGHGGNGNGVISLCVYDPSKIARAPDTTLVLINVKDTDSYGAEAVIFLQTDDEDQRLRLFWKSLREIIPTKLRTILNEAPPAI